MDNENYVSNNEIDPEKKQKCSLISEIQEPGIETEIRLKVKNIEEKKASNGQVYQKLYCRDISGCEATILNWNLKKRITSDLSKYPFVANMNICAELDRDNGFFYNLCQLEVIDSSALNDFEPENHIDPKTAITYINHYIGQLPDFLKAFVKCALNMIYKPFIAYPLTSNKAFSRRCGILEATCRLLEMVQPIIPILHLDPDIMTASAALYYCGFTITMNRSYTLMSGSLFGKEAAANILHGAYLKVMENEEFQRRKYELQYQLVRNIISARTDTIYTRESENFVGASSTLITKEAEVLRYLHEMLTMADYLDENAKTASDYTVVNLQAGTKLFKTPNVVPKKPELKAEDTNQEVEKQP